MSQEMKAGVKKVNELQEIYNKKIVFNIFENVSVVFRKQVIVINVWYWKLAFYAFESVV